jgi:hypothetical protein
VSTTLSEYTVNVTHGILRDGDVTEVDRFKETGLCSKHGRKAHAAGSGHDLSHTTMNSVGMQNNVHEVEATSTHLFFA